MAAMVRTGVRASSIIGEQYIRDGIQSNIVIFVIIYEYYED